ncbi:MAG: head-tail connector protein [Muribaculaceae bacterium]|nr:head-tail connector protein [Muribaculaceae bacterium]
MITDEDLRLLKDSARVDYDAEDEYLRTLLKTAEASIIRRTNRDRSELEDEETGRLKYDELRLAVCLLAKEWYENGGVSSPGNMTPALYGQDYLVKPFIKLVDDA